MGGLMSVQVPVPDERMLEMIAKLKRTSLSLSTCANGSSKWMEAVKDKDLTVLYQRFSKCDKEVCSAFSHAFSWV